MCNSVAIHKNCDTLPINNFSRKQGVRLQCPKNSLGVTSWDGIAFFVRLNAQVIDDNKNNPKKKSAKKVLCNTKRTAF